MRQSPILPQVCQWMTTLAHHTRTLVQQHVTPAITRVVRHVRQAIVKPAAAPEPRTAPDSPAAPAPGAEPPTPAAPSAASPRFSARASLAAIGIVLRQHHLLAPMHDLVVIPQKTVKHIPTAKLEDAFITLLAGGHGIADINTHLRCDPLLSRAFGRTACAEQSTVQRTLDACTAVQVQQMEQAVARIIRQHSQAYHHDYAQGFLLLDVDMTGLPCGRTAAFATPGYFAHQRNRRGRQLGRVLASDYDEVLVDRVFAGNQQLPHALQPLEQAARETLQLDAAHCQDVLIRSDSAGGSLADVNALLEQGYHVLVKEYSTRRARRLAVRVAEWVDDPHHPGRQVGWVLDPAPEYVRPVRRIAVRCRKRNGQWGIGVLITTLSSAEVLERTQAHWRTTEDETDALLATVALYDQRGGALETANRGDTQGLGLGKRNKQRMEAQQMVVLLALLAHNVTVWSRRWIAEAEPNVRRYGIQRMVRDVFPISGTLRLSASGVVEAVQLNALHPLARGVADGLAGLLRPAQVAVTTGVV